MSKGFAILILLCALGATSAGATAVAPPAQDTLGRQDLDALVADAKKTMMADPKAALQKARDAEAIAARFAKSPRRDEAVATSLWLEAEALTRMNRTGDARAVLNRAMTLAGADGKITKLDGDLALANARIAQTDGDVALALKSYQSAHDIFTKLGEARKQAIALFGLGAIYDEAHDFNREIRYYSEAGRVYSKDPAIELSVANNVGFAKQQLGQYDEALASFRKALDIGKSLKSPFLEADILSNIAHVYAQQHQLADATQAADQALKLLGKNDPNAPGVWGVKAEIELDRGAVDAAALDLNQAFRGVDLKATVAPFRDLHEIAFKVYRAQGNYPLALAHLEAFKRLDDAGRTLTASANLALMSAQFDFATQQFEIEHLKAEQLKRDIKLKESRAATQRVVFTALLFGALILMMWIGWRHFLVRRHRNAIRLKNVTLTQTLAERDVEIGRRIEVEEHLRLATKAAEEANRAKSHFLANMSHELRTPLNAIIGFSELMAHGLIKGPKLQEYSADINTSGQNLLTILNDILDMARIDTGTVTLDESELDLGEIVESVVREIADGAPAKTICFEDANRDVHLMGDDKRLRQILVNLLSNAVKFTGETGHIAVRIETVPDGIDIVVRDNGIGIPEDKLATVMEPFGQAESAYARLHGGVGLGLPIVNSLTRLHGGRFTLASEAGNGTEARVHLPMDRVPHVASQRTATVA
jgi:signal transduction histidine kinase/tetratricopeptide (TPR) repeat protein